MMSATGSSGGRRVLAMLRQFVREQAPVERCEMCGANVAAAHEHLVEPASRRLVCACQPCAILFSGQVETKYKRVPRLVRYLPDFQMTDAQWDALMIPVGMAFFFYSTTEGKIIALYPSPAGATESLLDLQAWGEIARANGILSGLLPDVEALLVNRVRGAAAEYYLVPIDKCYRLVGLIRAHWRGLSGGAAVWSEIARFFEELKAASGSMGEAARA